MNLPNIAEFAGPRRKEEAINRMRHLTRGGFVECFTSRRRLRWWSNGRTNGAVVAGIKGYSIQRTLGVKKPTRGRYNIIPLKIFKLIFHLYLGHDTETDIFLTIQRMAKCSCSSWSSWEEATSKQRTKLLIWRKSGPNGYNISSEFRAWDPNGPIKTHDVSSSVCNSYYLFV